MPPQPCAIGMGVPSKEPMRLARFTRRSSSVQKTGDRRLRWDFWCSRAVPFPSPMATPLGFRLMPRREGPCACVGTRAFFLGVRPVTRLFPLFIPCKASPPAIRAAAPAHAVVPGAAGQRAPRYYRVAAAAAPPLPVTRFRHPWSRTTGRSGCGAPCVAEIACAVLRMLHQANSRVPGAVALFSAGRSSVAYIPLGPTPRDGPAHQVMGGWVVVRTGAMPSGPWPSPMMS